MAWLHGWQRRSAGWSAHRLNPVLNISTRATMISQLKIHQRLFGYCRLVHQREVSWVLTRCHVEIQNTFLRANTVIGSAAVGARCAGRCVPHVNGASHWICREGKEHISEEMAALNRKKTCVWDLKNWFPFVWECLWEGPLPITAELGSSLLSLVFSQLYCRGLVPSLDRHLSTMSLPSCVGPSA